MLPHQKSNKSPHPVSTPDAIILCGGLGTRLRSVVPDRPKVLSDIGGTAFIDLLLERVSVLGSSRIILSIGYKGEMIRNHLERSTLPVVFSEETEPLGTGGAVKKALSLVRTKHCLVMNGDTFCNVGLLDFIHFHESHRTPLSVVVTPSLRNDGGGMTLSESGQITHFLEKDIVGKSFLNAGIYAFTRDIVSLMPTQSAFSLEYDLFPSLISRSPCFGYVTSESEEVIDIGTPERYHEAIRYFQTKR